MEPVLYLLIRNDLPSLNPGKLAAQASHITSVFENTINKKTKLYKEWANQTDYKFGTVITLSMDYNELNDFDVLTDETYYGENFQLVYDPTYPCEIDPEIGNFLYNTGYYNMNKSDGNFLIEQKDNNQFIMLRNELIGAYYFCDKSEENSINNFIKNLMLYN